MKLLGWSDGAVPGGVMQIGVVLRSVAGNLWHEQAERIGPGTVNEAEYWAAITAVMAAVQHGADVLTLHCDSELVVRQYEGAYSTKRMELRRLLGMLRAEAARLKSFEIVHIPGRDNQEADKLSRKRHARLGSTL